MPEESPDAVGRANIEALKPVYAEWAKGNFSPKFDVYSPEMEWGWSEEFPGLEAVSPDPDALRSSRLAAWLDPWEDWRCEAEEYVAAGDAVIVLCRYTGRGKESGVRVDTDGAHLWTLKDGKVMRLEVFSDRARALEAAGIER
jgi:ketosteroid isomerase-like protein